MFEQTGTGKDTDTSRQTNMTTRTDALTDINRQGHANMTDKRR